MKLFLLVLLVDICSAWNLTLLHVNDIHVRMDETNKYSSQCKEKDRVRQRCYGGISRIHTKVKEYRDQGGNLLWLNAGDFFQGTVWYTQFKWRVVSEFCNMLDFDAMTLGNHEFDDDIKGVVPFMKEQKAPIVVANINDSLVPDIQGLYQPSIIKVIDGKKIGIVGYTTPDTKHIAYTGDLIFTEEVDALTKEVANLKAEGADIIIALGHSGYEKDLEIARTVPDIDVVVGGHSHSFLFTETGTSKAPIDASPVRGPYPTLEHSLDGRKVLVVQAYAYTMFLGHLEITFDSQGEVTGWAGEPILLDSSVEKAVEIEAALVPWRDKLTTLTKRNIGSSSKLLQISRDGESELGNLVTDVMVWSYRNKLSRRGERIHLAMVNSGSIRISIDRGNITLEDLLTAFPFHNTFDLVYLTGATLWKVLEHGASQFTSSGEDGGGRFLQVSAGFKLVFDLRNPVGSRLVRAQVLDPDPALGYRDLNPDKIYPVVTTNYVMKGGDGFYMIGESNPEISQGPLDTDVLQEYMLQHSPLTAALDDRVVLLKDDKARSSTPTSSSSSSSSNTSSSSSSSGRLGLELVVFLATILSS